LAFVDIAKLPDFLGNFALSDPSPYILVSIRSKYLNLSFIFLIILGDSA
jgi:hypothetical protein